MLFNKQLNREFGQCMTNLEFLVAALDQPS